MVIKYACCVCMVYVFVKKVFFCHCFRHCLSLCPCPLSYICIHHILLLYFIHKKRSTYTNIYSTVIDLLTIQTIVIRFRLIWHIKVRADKRAQPFAYSAHQHTMRCQFISMPRICFPIVLPIYFFWWFFLFLVAVVIIIIFVWLENTKMWICIQVSSEQGQPNWLIIYYVKPKWTTTKHHQIVLILCRSM